MTPTLVEASSILTRSGGYLDGIASHSLQPYRGCTFGRSMCGVGCYVQHLPFVTQGQTWGDFLEVRANAADCYRRQHASEQRWARQKTGRFGIFCSSATDPFLPQESQHQITHQLLQAMLELPPDLLILQTHTHRITQEIAAIAELSCRSRVRVHLSIETDQDVIAGLPPPASSVQARLQAARQLREAGVRTVVTVAPLLPIRDPEQFFQQLAEVADAVVIDHFIDGDGSKAGARTRRTPLPTVMERVHPGSTELAYRDEIVQWARRFLPGRVGVGAAGFAGQFA